MTGPPGIAEAQELRDLVERLAGRVVARAAERRWTPSSGTS